MVMPTEPVRRPQSQPSPPPKRNLTFASEIIPGRCVSVVKMPIYEPTTKKIVGYKVTITTELD